MNYSWFEKEVGNQFKTLHLFLVNLLVDRKIIVFHTKKNKIFLYFEKITKPYFWKALCIYTLSFLCCF